MALDTLKPASPPKPSAYMEQFPRDITPNQHRSRSAEQAVESSRNDIEKSIYKRRRKERYRQNKERYRTSPVSFEEISEVDEEVQIENYQQQSRLWEGTLSFVRSKDDLCQMRVRKPPCLSLPNPKDGKRHHRSQESLLAMHGQQSLPTIPESPAIVDTDNRFDRYESDSYIPDLLPRTYTLP